jgi:hypothetical protein
LSRGEEDEKINHSIKALAAGYLPKPFQFTIIRSESFWHFEAQPLALLRSRFVGAFTIVTHPTASIWTVLDQALFGGVKKFSPKSKQIRVVTQHRLMTLCERDMRGIFS